MHDSSKIAICPLFLRSACPRPASTCPLSHHPNAHRSPHCVHFPNCTRGAACPYAHVRVSPDAAPCRDFVEVGWCDAGDDCDKRHVRECWRFAEHGKCDKVGCREPHVLRRTHTASEDEDDDDEEEDDEEGDEEGEEQEDDGEGEDEDDVYEDAVAELIEDAVERNEAERVFGGVDDPSSSSTTTTKKKRSRRDSSDASGLVGISGAAGRHLKRLKDQGADMKQKAAAVPAARTKRVFAGQDDFVTLEMPLSDDDDHDDGEEEEASSVDSEDLVDREDDDEARRDGGVVDGDGQPGTGKEADRKAAAAPPPMTSAPPRPRATDVLDQDALDYGDDDDEH